MTVGLVMMNIIMHVDCLSGVVIFVNVLDATDVYPTCILMRKNCNVGYSILSCWVFFWVVSFTVGFLEIAHIYSNVLGVSGKKYQDQKTRKHCTSGFGCGWRKRIL